VVLINKGRAIT